MRESRGVSRRRFLRLVGGTAAAVGTAGAFRPLPYAQAAADAPAPGTPLTVLAYNENAFGIFPSARAAILAAAQNGNRYPKETADALRDEIAHTVGVAGDMVVVGSGSIEPL